MRALLVMGEAALDAAVRELCPAGDGHRPVVHWDGRSAWCKRCGRTGRGEVVKVIRGVS